MAETSTTSSDAARLIQAHQAGVWRYLRALGCDAASAEDLTQETFLVVLEKPFQEYHPKATAAYLRKVAKNLFISLKRRAGKNLPLEEFAEVDAAWDEWAEDDGGEALIEALKACLETLGERARRALNLRFQERASRNAIAEDLQMSEHGAKNLMQRAKQQLRTCIEARMSQ